MHETIGADIVSKTRYGHQDYLRSRNTDHAKATGLVPDDHYMVMPPSRIFF